MKSKTADKRIVSKSAYVWATALETTLYVTGVFLTGLATLCRIGFILMSIITLVQYADSWTYGQYFQEWIRDLWLSGFLGAGAYLLPKAAKTTIFHAEHVAPGVPLTRVNIADLPALESLVRPSSEPLQAQEAVLLRAATKGEETHLEQLVRPTEL